VLTAQSHGVADFMFAGQPAPGVPREFSARMTGTIQAEISGTHSLRLIQCGRTRVTVDGRVIIDATEGEIPRGDEFFGMASAELEGDLELSADAPAEIVIEFNSRDSTFIGGFRVGLVSTVERDLIAEAEQVARECDAAVVVVGTNDDWETEGRDRDQFDLPGDQAELIRRVAAANPKTVVIVNTGGPHALDWLDAPNATLSVGFGGQEMGDALVDVLEGSADPGGRMPYTTPARYEHTPAYLNYPGENSVVRYGEGLFIGHRWFDARHVEPAVPFGHGLSYATFEWGTPAVVAAADTALAGPIAVAVDVRNTSDRAGSDVVQVYVEPPQSVLHRPVRELKGFAKVHLGPGESTTATIELDARAFAYYDPGDADYEALASAAPVPAEGGQRHTEAGWYVEPGDYQIVVGRSAADHVHVVTVTLSGDEHRFSARHEG
ncbi:MAG: hypothetical protein HKN26_08640, partial [Acidimicrobiales bacterium]|nr:hypothetical protein [Acidimicrobiales bacterium]